MPYLAILYTGEIVTVIAEVTGINACILTDKDRVIDYELVEEIHGCKS